MVCLHSHFRALLAELSVVRRSRAPPHRQGKDEGLSNTLRSLATLRAERLGLVEKLCDASIGQVGGRPRRLGSLL